jgi:hypothetical protein
MEAARDGLGCWGQWRLMFDGLEVFTTASGPSCASLVSSWHDMAFKSCELALEHSTLSKLRLSDTRHTNYMSTIFSFSSLPSTYLLFICSPSLFLHHSYRSQLMVRGLLLTYLLSQPLAYVLSLGQ